ncbi:hypothetical protein [Paenibacillus sp. NPDC057934]|uniref:hypothetical protein n=1 Tax=Paenibacillus sp. NPDC057934 TaxID=3346282 RepID=UPI0036D81B6A
MAVRGSKSNVMRQLESTLDEYEEYIPSKAWDALEKCFEDSDVEAEELESQLEEANERIKDLEKQLEEIEQ